MFYDQLKIEVERPQVIANRWLVGISVYFMRLLFCLLKVIKEILKLCQCQYISLMSASPQIPEIKATP